MIPRRAADAPSRSGSRRPHAPIAGYVLAAGIALIAASTLVGTFFLLDFQRQGLESRLHAENTDAADAFGQLTTSAAVAPAAIAGLFSGVGPANVTDSTFAEFARPLLDEQAVTALEWIPVVPEASRRGFEAARALVYPGYGIRQFAPGGTFVQAESRPFYYPVAYVEPLEPNRKALGVDLGSEPTRSAALLTARDTGVLAATAPITLAQGGVGILVSHPAYRPGSSHDDLTGRRDALLGFGLSVLRPAILLDRATSGDKYANLSFALWDLGPQALPQAGLPVLIAVGGMDALPGVAPPSPMDAGTDTVYMSFAGRRLALVAIPGPGYDPSVASPAWLLVLVGLMAIGLLLAYGYIRRRSDQRMEAANDRLLSVVGASPDAFLGLDAAGVVVDCTEQATELFGRPADQVLGHRIDDLVLFRALEDEDEDGEADDTAGTSRSPWIPSERTAPLVHHEGTVRRHSAEGESASIAVEVTMARTRRAGDWPIACFVRDVAELVRARQERARAGRLEALGQLAAGVAHDFRNTLWGIEMVADSLRSTELTQDAVHRDANLITDAVARGNALAAQLLEFARTKPPTGGPISIAATLRELAPMLEHLLGQHRRLVVAIEIEDADSMAVVERGQLQTALINLVANARDAMPDGGSVTIQAERVELGVTDADDLEITPGDYVLLRVTDTGTGMPPHVARRIFEPYFTTKEVGKGTGLGLATAFGTIRAADGAITVESELGQGTTFRILLPIDDPFDPTAH